MHAEAAAHAIPERGLNSPLPFGLGTMAHLKPFQCSTSVRVEIPFFEEIPAAQQSEPLIHATPFSPLGSDSAGELGLGMTDHREPSQCSTSVLADVSGYGAMAASPTAQQSDLLVQATALRES
jgi:hypothetical protein